MDELAVQEESDEKRWLGELLGLLTPVVKSWPSEHCLEGNKWAIQIFRGCGYTRDYPVERLYRDNRLNHIHEGTYGIQGLDLVERKIGRDGGATLFRFVDLVRSTVERVSGVGDLDEDCSRLSQILDLLTETTTVLLNSAGVARRTANATIFLDAFGHIVIAWMWLRQAEVAACTLANEDHTSQDRTFYEGKLAAYRYFSRYELPLAKAKLELCASLNDTCLSAPPSIFAC
ncbi:MULTISPECIES: acyl-CoA dehydrogenase [unclassified Pannonibacter]|uniref:acyl-CoA dehydrogenase n=1 Tax=unclassified Pannonibacter TaxID=2627228 RepID=UPI001AD90369|nr:MULTISPECIES: acyl-CoA dehydrogenase C-terminal domain-containing protein [unclassified Pannonibacter]